jgi:hypothetical protein
VFVDLVFETGKPCCITRWLPFKGDRTTIGQDQPCPGEQHPSLAKSDLIVVVGDQCK